MFRFVLASLILTLSSLCIGAEELRLSQEQQQKMEQLLPGVDVDQELVRALADIFYSRDMPVRVRLGAMTITGTKAPGMHGFLHPTAL